VLAQGARLDAVLHGFVAGEPVRLQWRLAPSQPGRLTLQVSGKRFSIELAPADRWQTPTLILPAEVVQDELRVRFESELGPVVLYHLWAVQRMAR
jgi:hypothetical protein